MPVPAPPLFWTESRSVGVEAIDAEHEALLVTLAGILDTDDQPLSTQEGSDFLERLLGLTVDHFRHEEEVMVQIGYPDFDSHRRAHIKLREQARFFKKTLDEEGASELSRTGLANFLSDWLADHLIAMDLQLRPYIARHVALNGPL